MHSGDAVSGFKHEVTLPVKFSTILRLCDYNVNGVEVCFLILSICGIEQNQNIHLTNSNFPKVHSVCEDGSIYEYS